MLKLFYRNVLLRNVFSFLFKKKFLCSAGISSKKGENVSNYSTGYKIILTAFVAKLEYSLDLNDTFDSLFSLLTSKF